MPAAKMATNRTNVLPENAATPLVVTAFIGLARELVKHTYEFRHSANVPAPYLLWCTRQDCGKVTKFRDRSHLRTKTILTDMQQLVAELAASLKRDPLVLWRAANHTFAAVKQDLADSNPVWEVTKHGRRRYASPTPLHCPSPELILIWLAKISLVARAMQLYPSVARFAWVDSGFNAYRSMRTDPPPPPWTRFWPTHGIAALRHKGACHNQLRSTNHTDCVVGTFMFGGRSAWRRLHHRFSEYTARLVDEAAACSPDSACGARGPKAASLCMDQDILADLASTDDKLFEWFTTDGEFFGWGWRDAKLLHAGTPSSVNHSSEGAAYSTCTGAHRQMTGGTYRCT